MCGIVQIEIVDTIEYSRGRGKWEEEKVVKMRNIFIYKGEEL
jgi:hypothetical protein